MFCPSDVNTGFIQLVGPILQQDLNSITIKSYPLSISFAPRTTIPTLIGNRIDESTENTCTFRGQRFSLVDVQISSVANQGYTLPGQTEKPVAELIISFSANNAAQDLSGLSGILMCVPIFDSGTPSHGDYLNQLIDPTVPSCDYTHLIGSDYTGSDYQQIPNSSLSNCIKSCCGDVNCLAYTYKSGTCYLKNSIPNLVKTGDTTQITGTVNHNVAANTGATTASCPVPNCPVPKCNGKHGKDKKLSEKKSGVPNLESIFYMWDGDTSQTSLAYKTCFETLDSNNNPTSRSLYVVVFPNGIHLTQAGYQQLLIQMNGNLPPYMIPPAIRGGDATLRSYRYNDEGNKVPTITSQDGIIYSTPISSCTDEFRHRFEYFTLPPRLPASVSARYNSDQCPYYKTSQYKCVPFNQLTDLSGAYVIPGNKTLETVMMEQNQALDKEKAGDMPSTSDTLTTEQIEGLIAGVAGVAIAAVLVIKIGSWISNNA
jgi:hypothetical protein